MIHPTHAFVALDFVPLVSVFEITPMGADPIRSTAADPLPPGVRHVNCRKHDELAVGTCRSCRGEYCDHCLVYAYGRAKPPFCIDCALSAFGVRSAGSNSVTDDLIC